MNTNHETAVFGGGCFWCTEAVFKMLKGVTSVLPGYAGGDMENPTYEDICGGDTGHAEVIKIEFDPSQIEYEKLLTVFFATHDSTQLNRQGNDVGTQYRSIVLYTTEEQKSVAEKFIAELEASSEKGGHITTQVVPLDKFYPAETYHQDYFAKNPGNMYCQVVINPKLAKVQEKFSEMLK